MASAYGLKAHLREYVRQEILSAFANASKSITSQGQIDYTQESKADHACELVASLILDPYSFSQSIVLDPNFSKLVNIVSALTERVEKLTKELEECKNNKWFDAANT